MENAKQNTIEKSGRKLRVVYGKKTWEILECCQGRVLLAEIAPEGRKMSWSRSWKTDFRESGVSAWLYGEFLQQLLDDGARADHFAPMRMNIGDLEKTESIEVGGIGVLSMAQAMRYRGTIPACFEWEWTCTPIPDGVRGPGMACVCGRAEAYAYQNCLEPARVRPVICLYDSVLGEMADQMAAAEAILTEATA